MTNEEIRQMLPVGTLLNGGSYRVVRYIASGGFGNTYEVEDVMLGKHYAMKEFFMRGVNTRQGTQVTMGTGVTSETISITDRMRRKFLEEAQRLARLENPHIVRVIRLFEENQTVYYVMDLISGTSLNKVVADGGPLPEPQVRDILGQVLSALGYVHAQGLYHLDLKPANLMQDAAGHITLIDFGASKQMTLDDSHSMTTTALPYTPGYAPAEQVNQNKKNIGPWTDFYALGATLFNLLTAQTPPPSDEVVSEGAAAFAFPPSVSTRMQQLIVWMMQPGRNQRPQSVAEITQRLGGQTTVITTPVVPSADNDTVVTPANHDTVVGPVSHETVVAPASRRPRRLWPWLAGVAAVAAVIIGVLLLGGKDATPAPVDADEDTLVMLDATENSARDANETPALAQADETTPDQPAPAVADETPTQSITPTQPTHFDGCPDANHPHAIDLGLPSGTKWACCNVGAARPDDYGGYYAWGETSTKSTYTWENYHYGSSADDVQNIGSDIAGTQYDVAHTNWGGAWRMPTVEQCQELINNTRSEWTTLGGVAGRKFTASNGNYVFLPAGGWRWDGGLSYRGEYGDFWASSLNESGLGYARYLYFSSGGAYASDYGRRYYGRSVRPVRRN